MSPSALAQAPGWTQPTLTDTPSKSRRNSTTPRYELRQIGGSATITWRSHTLVTANSNSTSLPIVADEKASSRACQFLGTAPSIWDD